MARSQGPPDTNETSTGTECNIIAKFCFDCQCLHLISDVLYQGFKHNYQTGVEACMQKTHTPRIAARKQDRVGIWLVIRLSIRLE